MRLAARTTRLLAGPVLLLAACGSPQAACTMIGADSNVQVGYEKVLRAGPSRDVTVEACVGTVCHTVHEPAGTTQRSAQAIGGGGIHDATPITVRLTITEDSGKTLFRGDTEVTPQKLQPNGPDCPPTAWVARVDASGKHTLTAVRPPV